MHKGNSLSQQLKTKIDVKVALKSWCLNDSLRILERANMSIYLKKKDLSKSLSQLSYWFGAEAEQEVLQLHYKNMRAVSPPDQLQSQKTQHLRNNLRKT